MPHLSRRPKTQTITFHPKETSVNRRESLYQLTFSQKMATWRINMSDKDADWQRRHKDSLCNSGGIILLLIFKLSCPWGGGSNNMALSRKKGGKRERE